MDKHVLRIMVSGTLIHLVNEEVRAEVPAEHAKAYVDGLKEQGHNEEDFVIDDQTGIEDPADEKTPAKPAPRPRVNGKFVKIK